MSIGTNIPLLQIKIWMVIQNMIRNMEAALRNKVVFYKSNM